MSAVTGYAGRLTQTTKRAAAIITALLIFLMDSLSTLDIAIAVLYVAVILISVDMFSRKGVLCIALGCCGLTMLAYVSSHGLKCSDDSCGRCIISLSAIVVTAYLALKHSTAKSNLQEQLLLLNRSEAFLAGAQSLSLTGSFGFLMPRTEMYLSTEAKRILEFDDVQKPTLEEMVKLIHTDDQARVRTAIHQVVNAHALLEIEFRLVMTDGRLKTLRMLASPFAESHNTCEFMGALMDVTAARTSEEALQRTQSELAHITRVTTLGELAASIAHEVNQPLAAVITNAESGLRWLNRNEPDVVEVRRAIERIIAQANRASEVVKRVRAISRKAAPEHRTVDVSELVNETVQLVEREIKRNKITLRCYIDEHAPLINGDRVQLQQVIINLIINAIQAMSYHVCAPREVLIVVKRADTDDLGVTVRDNGPGIPEKNISSLFEPFFTTKPKGVGMGLAICRSIIEAHGGRIWASSEPGRGASFNFSLPQYGKPLI
ncbi:PAS domain-containing protein [Pseudomonas sp. DR48]|nr:PAS domain-containing protein [Pseudomonas sp. DR48]